jgi:hypothetical protein
MSDEVEIGGDRLGPHGDEFYAALMATHDSLSFEQSAALNARLVLVLANLVGDPKRLEKALATALKGVS